MRRHTALLRALVLLLVLGLPLSFGAEARKADPRGGAQTPRAITLWGGQRLASPIRRAFTSELLEHGRSLMVVVKGVVKGKVRSLFSKLPVISKAIVGKEVAKAGQIDPRSTPGFVKHWYRRFLKAQALKPVPQRVLFGFTRVVDAKVKATDGLLSALHARPEIDASKLEALRRAGPRPDGKWGPVDSPEKLLAAVDHHHARRDGKSLQLQINRDVEAWLAGAIAQTGTRVDRAVGGAAAFGANLATTFEGTAVTFHSAQPVSPEQARGFVPKVGIVTRESGPAGIPARNQRAADPASPTKTNYILEAPGAGSGVGRIILSTEASYPPTFDGAMGKRALAALARANDVFVMVGPHYLTGYQDHPLDRNPLDRTGSRLRWQLREMRKANRDLLVHYQYVSAKDPAKEWKLFRHLDGMIDSLSLNATELGPLCENLAGRPVRKEGGTLHLPSLPPAMSDEDHEQPARIHKLATALMRGLGLERLHIHGRRVDMILVRGGSAEQMHREGQAALKGRQLGMNKVVNPSGQVRSERETWSLVPTVEGESLAALHRFGDALRAAGRIDESERARVVKQGFYLDRSAGIAVSVTPTRQFHLEPGGRVSLGDTIDITALLHAHRPGSWRRP